MNIHIPTWWVKKASVPENGTRRKLATKTGGDSVWDGDVTRIPTFVINLERQPERWEEVSRRLGPSLPLLTRFPATDGKLEFKDKDVSTDSRLSVGTRSYLRSGTPRLGPQEINHPQAVCCYLSHLRVWKHMVEHNIPRAMVLEDKQRMQPHHIHDIQAAWQKHNGQRWVGRNSVWFLGSFLPVRVLMPNTRPSDEQWPRPYTNAGGHAYILTQQAARTLVAHALPMDMHVDWYMRSMGRAELVQVVASRDVNVTKPKGSIPHPPSVLEKHIVYSGVLSLLLLLVCIVAVVLGQPSMSKDNSSGGGGGGGDDGEHKKKRPTLQKFPMERLDELKRVLFIGSTTCGKTTGLYDFVKHMHRQAKRKKCRRHKKTACAKHAERWCEVCGTCAECRKVAKGIQTALGFSLTEDANGNLGGPVRDNDGNIIHKYALMPKCCAHHGFHESILSEAMDYQIATKSAGRGKSMLVVLDDVLAQKGVKNCAKLNEFMQNARNYKSGLVCAMHQPKQLSPQSRGQFHFVVCYGLGKDDMKAFYDSWASKAFPNFKAFENTWRRISKKLGKYWAMVIDLHAGGAVSNRVFKYKAPNPDADDYHIPHICEKGLWWIQKHMQEEAKAANMQELFDLETIARARGVRLPAKVLRSGGRGAPGAGAGGGAGGGSRKRKRGASRWEDDLSDSEEEIDELFI